MRYLILIVCSSFLLTGSYSFCSFPDDTAGIMFEEFYEDRMYRFRVFLGI